MVKLLDKLYRTRLLTPIGLVYLIEAVLTTGVNLMALLRLAARLHPYRIALSDDREQLSYSQLWQQAESLAVALQLDYGLKQQQRVAIACRNHAALVKAIFAASRLGTDVFLFNPEMSSDQTEALLERLAIDFYIYDPGDDRPVPPWLAAYQQRHKALAAYHPTAPSIAQLAATPRSTKPLKTVKTGQLVVMTGGTTGQPKPASRRPAIFNFLPPFIALLEQVELDRYRSLYIATPIYHGFGLAALLMGILLGGELYLSERFAAAQACALIARQQIEVVTLVPLMLQRMLNQDRQSLICLQRILTGGAPLSPTLARATLEQLGSIVFNLYGTSEAGFCILGTPELLSRKPGAIGQPVWGVQAQVVDEQEQEVGRGKIGHLWIRTAWSTQRNSWIKTGDLAYWDPDHDLFLAGRIDDMVVSGGENVYPIDLETILLQHPQIAAAVVFGIPDQEFGQRLKAVIVRQQDTTLTAEALRQWLKPRVARYQMPGAIEFREQLPYTALGKLDRKSLRE